MTPDNTLLGCAGCGAGGRAAPAALAAGSLEASAPIVPVCGHAVTLALSTVDDALRSEKRWFYLSPREFLKDSIFRSFSPAFVPGFRRLVFTRSTPSRGPALKNYLHLL
jgi:hypothetical protein